MPYISDNIFKIIYIFHINTPINFTLFIANLDIIGSLC